MNACMKKRGFIILFDKRMTKENHTCSGETQKAMEHREIDRNNFHWSDENNANETSSQIEMGKMKSGFSKACACALNRKDNRKLALDSFWSSSWVRFLRRSCPNSVKMIINIEPMF